MRIGIIGGAGFIGGHVADVATERDHEVLVFDHKGRASSGHEVMLGDVRDSTAVTELAAHVDGVIHLAACLGTQETIQNPRPAAETNVMGGLNFLEAITQYDIPGVYIGVGNWWMENSYSISKHTIERYTRMFNNERGTRCNVVRLVNAYGPRQSVAPPFGPAKVRKITPAFVCRALTRQDIEVYGDGEQVSDMVYVRDGALALVKALEKAAEGVVFDKAVECGPPVSATVNQVAEQVIERVADFDFPRVGVTHLPMRPGEIPGAKVTADVSTLKLVDIDPADLVDLESGLSTTVQWFVEKWLPEYMAGRR